MEIRKIFQRSYDVFSNGSSSYGTGSPARREKRRALVPNRPLQTLTNNNMITDQSKRLIHSHLAPSAQRGYFPTETDRSSDGISQSATSRVPTFTASELAVGQFHIVYCSYAEDGPNLFSVQLKSQEHILDRMAVEIPNAPRVPLSSKVSTGMACIVRYSEDRNLYRAVIQKVYPDGCRVTFIDYGNSEFVPYSEMFEIPANLLEHRTFAMSFQLHGCKELGPSDKRINEHFTALVNDTSLELKVIPSKNVQVQQCELYLPNGRNILHLLKEKQNEFCTYPNPPNLKDGDYVVIRSAVTAKQFYVQRFKDTAAYDAMMDALLVHCYNAPEMTSLPSKDKCCAARYKGDNKEWYRVIVKEQKGAQHVEAQFVDFGHSLELHLSDLRDITPQFMALPRQAIECCLVDFETVDNVPELTRASLEMLITNLNNEPIKYKASVRRRLPNSAHVVDLHDEEKDLRVSISVYKNAMPLGPKPYNKPLPKGVNEVEKPARQAPTNRINNNYQNQRECDGAERPEKFVESNVQSNDRQRERVGRSKSSNDDGSRYERVKPRNDNGRAVTNGSPKNYSNGEKSKK